LDNAGSDSEAGSGFTDGNSIPKDAAPTTRDTEPVAVDTVTLDTPSIVGDTGGSTTFPAFLSRPPLSSPIVISNASNIELSNFSYVGGTVNAPKDIVITLENVKKAWIHDIDFANVIGGIYVYQSEDVVIERVRARNVGDGSIGSCHSNFIQFAESRGGAIRDNRFVGGRTEDMISTWHSGGWGLGMELVIENNQLEGLIADTPDARAWTSTSGTGIIISDGGGHPNNGWIIVRHNTLLNPGQVGIQHIDGPGLQTHDNVIYAEPYGPNNNSITSWEGVPQGEVWNNRYRFIKSDGSEPAPWFHGQSQLNVHDNVYDTSLDPATLHVAL
jgi:hypothetical protein